MSTVDDMVQALNQFHRLTKEDFDAIAERFGLDPDDSLLVEKLSALGWTYVLDEPYSYIKDVPDEV